MTPHSAKSFSMDRPCSLIANSNKMLVAQFPNAQNIHSHSAQMIIKKEFIWQ
jgi:hypothetical protein